MDLVSFFSRLVEHRRLHSFPTRRSSDLPTSELKSATAASLGILLLCIRMSSASASSIPSGGRHADAEQQDSRSEEHTSELQSRFDLVCRLLLEKKKTHRQLEHLAQGALH